MNLSVTCLRYTKDRDFEGETREHHCLRTIQDCETGQRLADGIYCYTAREANGWCGPMGTQWQAKAATA